MTGRDVLSTFSVALMTLSGALVQNEAGWIALAVYIAITVVAELALTVYYNRKVNRVRQEEG